MERAAAAFVVSGFLDVADRGDLEGVKRILLSGLASITEADQWGFTALLLAIIKGHATLAQWLVLEGGARVDQADQWGKTAFLWASVYGDVPMAKFLFANGASVTETDLEGTTALLFACKSGHYPLVHWLLVEGGASIKDVCANGDTVWTLLGCKMVDLDNDDVYDVLACLLRVMVLLDEAPVDFIAKLSPRLRRVAMRGNKLRSRLPAYLEQQRARIAAHFPLPAVLQPLVAGYAEPTHEEIWTEGLRVWVLACCNPGCGGAGLKKCAGCKQARYCGQECQKAHRSAHKADCRLWSVDTTAASTVATTHRPARDTAAVAKWNGWAIVRVAIPAIVLGVLVARRLRML